MLAPYDTQMQQLAMPYEDREMIQELAQTNTNISCTFTGCTKN